MDPLPAQRPTDGEGVPREQGPAILTATEQDHPASVRQTTLPTSAPTSSGSHAANSWVAMSVRMHIWRADGGLIPLLQTGTPNEKQLEGLLEKTHPC